jgi:hypothetical protein
MASLVRSELALKLVRCRRAAHDFVGEDIFTLEVTSAGGKAHNFNALL